jgi:hypothetical protein
MAMRAKVNSSMNGSDASSSFFGNFLLPGLFRNWAPIRVPWGGESPALSSAVPSSASSGVGVGSELVASSNVDDTHDELEDETVEPSAVLALDHDVAQDVVDRVVITGEEILPTIDELGEDEGDAQGRPNLHA